MTKEEFITERTRIISEMLDNPDKYGIYPTTKCFEALDELFDKINPTISDEEIQKWAEKEWSGRKVGPLPEIIAFRAAVAMRDGLIKKQ